MRRMRGEIDVMLQFQKRGGRLQDIRDRQAFLRRVRRDILRHMPLAKDYAPERRSDNVRN
jgi:hypothetical protein